jgi:hypothetical protein
MHDAGSAGGGLHFFTIVHCSDHIKAYAHWAGKSCCSIGTIKAFGWLEE